MKKCLESLWSGEKAPSSSGQLHDTADVMWASQNLHFGQNRQQQQEKQPWQTKQKQQQSNNNKTEQCQ